MNPDERRRKILRDAGFRQNDPLTGKAHNNSPEPPVPRTRVESLVAEKPIGRIELVVLRRYPRRLVNSSKWSGYVAAACGRDETGLVGLVLWGEQVDKVRVGDIVRIEAGWCRRHAGDIVVSSGRNGRLSVLEA